MSGIAENLCEIREKIAAACMRVGRNIGSVELIAVSKTFAAEDIVSAIDAGQRVFGESRQQEAAPKIQQLPAGLEWHFIGRVQSNKVRKILPLFGFVHAVDSLDLAEIMDRIAGELGLRPKVFLQVNLATEQSKGGFGEAELRNSMDRFAGLKYVNPVGLMTIPPAADDAEDSRHWFKKLRQLRDELTEDHDLALPYLSMGMSGDFEIAIEEGATHVRVGSAIFGKREYKIEGELG
jgi:pyridoxal phosphate enzyme (YggS family)